MQILFLSPWYLESAGHVPPRGGPRAVPQLVKELRRRGHTVQVDRTAQYFLRHRATGPDLLVLEGAIAPSQRGLLEQIAPRRAWIWRHGDESMLTRHAAAVAHDPRVTLVVPSQRTADMIDWHLPRVRVLWSALEDPARVAPHPRDPSGHVLHLVAGHSQKNTPFALAVARSYPRERFVFRADYADLAGPLQRESPDHVQVLPPTQDQEELWRGAKLLLVPSLFETFSMAAYEACARDIPVVVPSWLRCVHEWAPELARVDTPERALDGEPLPVGAYRAIAERAYAAAGEQLDSLLG